MSLFIKSLYSKLLLMLLGLVFMPAAIAGAPTTLVYGPTSSTEEQRILQYLKKENIAAEVISLVNEKFKLPRSFRIVFGGNDGPLYDPEANDILIPYGFVAEVEERFGEVKYSQTGVSVEQATEDALMHTLYHELGHALINMFELPVVGKEEDAVDGLANVLLIEFYQHGQETVISAADLFDLESTDREVLEEADFWDEHSLDAQRFYSALCHVYGSDPDKYASVLEGTNTSDERAELCIEEYETLRLSWFELLGLK